MLSACPKGASAAPAPLVAAAIVPRRLLSQQAVSGLQLTRQRHFYYCILPLYVCVYYIVYLKYIELLILAFYVLQTQMK